MVVVDSIAARDETASLVCAARVLEAKDSVIAVRFRVMIPRESGNTAEPVIHKAIKRDGLRLIT